jgi:hypothetical protein
VAPVGRAQNPLQSLLRSTAQSSLRASMETTTRPFRRWQPPRVTSTTGMQLDHHLVPLDAISQCNRTRITQSQSIHTLASTRELEGSQALSSMDTKFPKVLNFSHGRAPRHSTAAGSGRQDFTTCQPGSKSSIGLQRSPRAPGSRAS